MSNFLIKNDEYINAPNKNTVTSFKIQELQCLSPYGPVSNINCPKDDPYCTCPGKLDVLKPEEPEPTDEELTALRNDTYECTLINEILNKNYVGTGLSGDAWNYWLGIDYSNPKASYNCFACLSGVSGTTYRGVTASSPNFFEQEECPEGQDCSQTESENTKQKFKYFNYDARKLFEQQTSNFPYPTSGLVDSGSTCDNDIIGRYFKYYKEYSNTNATFWNTPPKTILYRKAQTTLMKVQRIKILIHGNWNIKPGKIVEIGDSKFNGRWMVYKTQRIITTQKHSMYLFLMRDGVR